MFLLQMCIYVQSRLVSRRDKKTDLLILADDALQSLLSSPLRTMLLSDNCLGANCSHSGGVLFLSRRNF